MHPFHISQCSIQNRNVHISALNGALWDMEKVNSGICELGKFKGAKSYSIIISIVICQCILLANFGK